MSTEEISYRNDFSESDVEILDITDKKSRLNSRGRIFYALLSKYWRIFTIAETHYAEKNEGVYHVFCITFADIWDYLNPQEIRPEDRDNIGCIYYMFNFKSDNHRYCILPPTTWKLVNHIFKIYDKMDDSKKDGFDKFIKNERIKNFHDCMYEIDENNIEPLMRCYNEVGGLQGVIDIAADCKLNDRLKQNFSVIQKMLDDKIIEPLEHFNVGELTQIKPDKKRYDKALENLMFHKPNNVNVENKICALNLAITCYLTEKFEKFDDIADKMYNTCKNYKATKEIYRQVPSSRETIDALRRMKTDDGKRVSCCPQFLTVLILLKRNLAEKMDIAKLDERIAYLAKKRECLGRLRTNSVRLQYLGRFTAEEYLNENLVEENLLSLCNYLSDLIEFKEQIFPIFITPVLKINEGDITYHRGGKNYSQEPIESLEQLSERPKCYNEFVMLCFEDIYADVEDVYKFLYKHATKKYSHVLSPKMISLMERLDNPRVKTPKRIRSLRSFFRLHHSHTLPLR